MGDAASSCRRWGWPTDGVKVTSSQQLHRLVGHRVTVVGVAKKQWVGVPGGFGAMVDGGAGFHVWIDNAELWPTNYVDRPVQVEGILMQRHQAAVTNFFIQEPALPGMSAEGVAGVRKGFDYYVIHDAKFGLSP